LFHGVLRHLDAAEHGGGEYGKRSELGPCEHHDNQPRHVAQTQTVPLFFFFVAVGYLSARMNNDDDDTGGANAPASPPRGTAR